MQNFGSTQTLTILRKTKANTDEYGLPVYNVSRETITGVLIAPGSNSITHTVGASESTVEYTVYIPKSIALEGSEGFEIAGEAFYPQGEPERWTSPFGGLSVGTVLKLGKKKAGE